ncbi:MAG: acyl-CoA synthetase [bacterium]
MLEKPGVPIIARALKHTRRVAILDGDGAHTYGELLEAAEQVAFRLLGERDDLREARVAFCVPPGFSYSAVQWGIWLAGGIAVPLFPGHPLPEIEYELEDTAAASVIAHGDLEAKLRPAAARSRVALLSAGDLHRIGLPGARYLPKIEPERRAQILYTSGTTSRPKGVVTTHRNITAQITSLTAAWEWQEDDRILHALPLHHTHGIINALGCALWSGAACEMLPGFDAGQAWERFAQGRVTLFMAVPTMYVRLIAAWRNASPEKKSLLSRACRRMRLMVSGSAALPVEVFNEWQRITGHRLLERYGMTEIGMALSNPLRGDRRPGHVGEPLPGVTVRLVGEDGLPVQAEGEPGEIEVRGDNVFLEYWQRPEATRAAFHDGWFRTGDVALLERGYYRILGRSSVDIIKTGGYKVSALEVEEVLRTHPGIRECAVVGVEDPEWGERVAAAVVLDRGSSLSLEELRDWAKERLAGYKVPSRLACLDELPRNVLGKVTKPELKKRFAGEAGQG